MTPESIGNVESSIVLGKHSGRHAFKERLRVLGYELSKNEVDEAFARFKNLADRKKTITNDDLEALVSYKITDVPERYALESFEIRSGNRIQATAVVTLASRDGDGVPALSVAAMATNAVAPTLDTEPTAPDLPTAPATSAASAAPAAPTAPDLPTTPAAHAASAVHAAPSLATATSVGDGPVDAAYNAIAGIIGGEWPLASYDIRAVTGGEDAQGEVTVRVKKGERLYTGRGLSTDIIEASIRAYINAINRVLAEEPIPDPGA